MDNIYKKKFKAKVIDNTEVVQGVYKITCLTDVQFTYTPGQYIWLEIPKGVESDPKGNRRAFSIINTSYTNGAISIIARLTDSIYKKTLCNLTVGSDVFIHGPFGSSFILDESNVKSIVMVAGGVGVAPFLSVIEHIKKESLKIKCYLYYFNRNSKEIPFLKELNSFKRFNKFFDYKIYEEDLSWEMVEGVYNKDQDSQWWVSGPQAMVDHVYEVLFNGGVSKNRMIFENFYPKLIGSLTKDIVDKQLSFDNVFASAIQNSTNHTIITDVDGVVLFANKAAQRITGYSLEEILGNTPRLWGGLMSPKFYIDFWQKKFSGEPFMGEIINRRKNGEIYYAIAHIAQIFNKDNKIVGFIGTEEDITDLKNSEQKIIDKNNDLEKINKIMIDRELKMIELKEKIRKLES